MGPIEKKLRYQQLSLLKRKQAQGVKKTTIETIKRSLAATNSDEGLAQFVYRGRPQK